MTADSSKWKQVVMAIKKLIVSGEWKPGVKLPTYDELEVQFKVSRITLQQVVSQLKRDGYITSLARQGLFVSTRPPHLTRIGIAIPREENQNRFWRELVNSAHAVADLLGKELVVYRNLERSNECEKRLIHDTENYLLSGMIFPYTVAPDARGYSVFSNPLIPKAISSRASLPGLTLAFHVDEEEMVRRGVDYLQECGCSRIACFANLGPSLVSLSFAKEVEKRRLYSPPEWLFQIAMENVEIAGKIAQILMALPENERPNGIFIGDDNYTSIVVKGLASTNIRLPDELPVVTHYNWSVGLREHFPVKSLGFDLQSIMFKIFNAFHLYHESGNLPESLVEPAVFEEELNRKQVKGERYHEKAV